MRAALGSDLPEGPSDPVAVIDELVAGSASGIVNIPSGRYFGFVIGGSLPAATAADLLTSVWDQNCGLFAAGPAASVVEEVAGTWLKELLGLPRDCSYAFVTGTQMAHFVALAAARHHLLAQGGWDVESDGLFGSPSIRVIAGAERHVTVDRALRYLGMGTSSLEPVAADDQGRLEISALKDALAARGGPTVVCLQAGNVNSGSVDPIAPAIEVAHEAGAWVHVDGAFGLWAAASPELVHLVEGVGRADSWATDGHKWLNVPYDSGLVFCAHPASHRAAISVHAEYLVHSEGAERDEMDWTPEFSRRARGFTVYAALRSLGRSGVRQMIEHSCAMAQRFATKLAEHPGVEIVNEVVLNQVLVRFSDDNMDAATKTPVVVKLVQEEGTCWLSGSVWQGAPVMRISVSNWSTTEEDVDVSIDSILRAADRASAG